MVNSNALMFEVGVDLAKKQFDAIQAQIKEYTGKWEKNLKIKVSIENLSTLTDQLRQLGDSKGLQTLRKELEALNKEFVLLSKGAGGEGSITKRGLEQQIQREKDLLEGYNKRMAELMESRKKYNERSPQFNIITQGMENVSFLAKEAERRIAEFNAQLANLGKNQGKSPASEFEQLANAIKNIGNNDAGLNKISGEMTALKSNVDTLAQSVKVLVEQLQQKSPTQGNLLDPQKFTSLQESVDKIISEIDRLQKAFQHLGDNNSLSSLSTMINGLAVTLSSLSNAVKVQPLDEQVKTLLERCERAEAKLREVGDAAKYFNERAGAKTQQKASAIAGIAGEEEQVTKASNTWERYIRLLYEVENQMSKIGQIQALAEKLGISPVILKQAQTQLEKLLNDLKKGITYDENQKPILNLSPSQITKMTSGLSAFKAEYRDVIKEADRFNKVNERDILKKKSEELREYAANIRTAENEARKLTVTISNLEAFANKADAMGVDTAKLRALIAELKTYKQTLEDIASGKDRQSAKSFISKESVLESKRDIKEVTGEIRKEMKKALTPDNEGANALKEYISLLRQIANLTKTANRAEALGIDAKTLRNQIVLLEQYAKALEQFASSKGAGFNAWIQSHPAYGEARVNIAADQAKMNKEIADAKHANTIATAQLTESEKRFLDAIRQSTDSMKSQSQVLSDLKMLATQYLSVWGAQSFIQNIIQTGGLLEQQRLSIGAILQNAGQATELFGKIKALAVQSPFGVVELDRMSKQLTAYGFEYKELYDWTKRLGDISAATGTGVDRLALALGHVRSEGALSGYTLRQFAMGNVPVLRMLSENLGISTKQVREKVRKKEISYEDVQNVLKQLTDEGGMFYKAQETMSQALNAKFKNLHDAFDIMYGEIAESGVGNALKRLAEILTAGAKEWGRYAKDIMGVVTVLGLAKAAMWAYNVAQARGLSTSLNAVAAAAKQERENLKLANTYRKLTAEEKAALGPKSALARAWYGLFAPMKLVSKEQLALAISDKKLTQEDLLRAVALRKLNIEQAKAAVLASNLSRAQKAMMIGALNNVTVLGKWRIALLGLGNAMKGVFSLAKTFAPLLAITAIMDMFARVSEMKDKAKEASAELAEKATSDLKVLGETFKELQDSGFIKSINSVSDKFINGKRVVANVIEFDDSVLNGKDLTNEINELKAKLQDMSPMYEGDLVDIDKMDNQVEQVKLIIKKLESIRHANDVTEALSDVVTGADIKVAGKNWFTRLFGDSYTQDVKDYEDRLKSAEEDIIEINEQTIEEIDKELGGQLEQLQKKYSLDSKNNALVKLFSDWAKKGGVPEKYKSKLAPTAIEELYNDKMAGGLSRSLKSQYEQMTEDTKEMASKLSSIVVNQFANDPDGAIYAITNYINKLMSMAGVTDPRVIEEATRVMLEQMRKNLPQNLQTGVVDEMQRRILMEKFVGFLGNTITESTTPEEAQKALDKYSDMTIKWGEQMGYDLEKIGMKNADAYRDGIEAKMNSVKINIDWQKRASEVFVVNTVLKTNIDKSLDEFAQAVQKDLKAKQDYLTRNKHHLKMTLNIDTDILMNADKLKTFMDKLAQQGQKKAMEGDWEGAKAIYSKIDSELKPYYNALMSVQEDKAWLKKEGYPEKDPTKGKGSTEDKNAKAVRERVRVMKEAADAFQYWRDKVGVAGAWTHVQEEFGKVLTDIGVTVDNIEDLKDNLERVKTTKEFSAIKDKKVKTEIEKEIAKEQDQLRRKDFEKSTEEFLSKTQLQLDNLTRSWEQFNKVREATGDITLAMNIAGVTYQEGQHNIADAVRKKVEDDFKSFGVEPIEFSVNIDEKKMTEDIQKAFNDVAPKREDYADSQEGLEAYNKALMEHQEKIKGVVAEYKKWQELQRQIEQEDLDVFAKLAGSAVDLESQLKKINDEYYKQIESLYRLKSSGKINDAQYNQAMNIQNADTRMKVVQAQKEYQFLIDGVITMNKEAAQTVRREYVEALRGKLLAGSITAKEYADKIEEINDKMHELETQDTDAISYLKGGTDGFIGNMKKRAKAQQEEGAAEMQQAQKLMELADSLGNSEMFMKGMSQMKSGQEMASAGQGLSQFASGMGTTIAYIDTIVHGINNIVQGFKAIIDELDEMFEALGEDTQTGRDDFRNFFNSFSAASSKATQGWDSLKNGDVMGAFAGVIGSFTQWVVGFAKAHDQRREYEIRLAEQELKVLSNIDNRLDTQIERTLGGATRANIDERTLQRYMRYNGITEDFTSFLKGDAESFKRLFMTLAFSTTGENWGSLSKETKEAISSAVYNRSAVAAQYASILEQRDQVQRQLDNERDKKDSDSSAIEEYQQKIAELNDQIRYFVEDTAKELYGLDLKGWADQIGDALWTAFENGEDAMEAFRDTAKDVVKDVAQEMLKLGVIQPMMENLRKKLFEEEWTDANGNTYKGVYNQSTGRFDEEKTLEILGDYFGEGGELERSVEASQQFYEWVQKITGMDLSSEDSSKSSGTGIKSITEQTADLIASYLNSCRADLAVNRSMIAQYFPQYLSALTSGNANLRNIESHTLAIMRSNDIIADRITSLDNSISSLRNKAWKVPVA